MNIEEIKAKIESLQKGITNPNISEPVKAGMTKAIDKLKSDLEALEKATEKKVEQTEAAVEKAEEKLDKAKKSGDAKDVKKAKAEVAKAEEKLDDAKDDEKKVAAAAAKAEALAKRAHGGKRPNAGRKEGSKTKTPKKQVAKVTEKVEIPKKEETTKAWGQTITWKSEAEFCTELRKAYLRRRKVYKTKGKKTKPVFQVITSKIGDAVEMAVKNVSHAKIEKNPKEFLSMSIRLEKSAKTFLENFKALLGADFKKGDIAKEFGDVEATINKLVSKFQKAK